MKTNNDGTAKPFAEANGSALWQVWFEPTEKGAKAFDWKAEAVGAPIDNREDADFECYLNRLEEPAPDFGDYGRYVVREVSPNGDSATK